MNGSSDSICCRPDGHDADTDTDMTLTLTWHWHWQWQWHWHDNDTDNDTDADTDTDRTDNDMMWLGFREQENSSILLIDNFTQHTRH